MRGVVAMAINAELARTKINEKYKKVRLPSDLISIGAKRKKATLPIAPIKIKILTVLVSKNSLKKDECT